MEQTEVRDGVEKLIAIQNIWTTLTVAQREQVLQVLVQICCQILTQQQVEVKHEPAPN